MAINLNHVTDAIEATSGILSLSVPSNPQTLSTDTTIPSSTNAGVLGPSYTIATGVTLTISTGSFFRVI